jgi:tRNA pseudouridine38-40 synthase
VPTFKITIAYDGTDFVGWQRQATGTSVQGLLEEALRALDERDVTVTGAGRTDAGVHALGQVAAFTLERSLNADAVVRALNARLPDAVRIVAADEVPASFNPRFDARAKTYRYRIWNGDVLSPFERRYAWHLPGALNVDAMCQAACAIEGEHDFASFQSAGTNVATTVRDVARSTITTERTITERTGRHEAHGDHGNQNVLPVFSVDHDPVRVPGGSAAGATTVIGYEITGTGFLRHMVRAIVGSLVEIGRGRQPVEWLSEVLASRDRAKGGPTAPAHGLFLVSVDYEPRTARKRRGSTEEQDDFP